MSTSSRDRALSDSRGGPVVWFALVGLLIGWLLSVPAHAGGAIHAKLETTDGRTLTGPIRWDRNENFWDDVLNASRPEPVVPRKQERRFKLSLFGLDIGGDSDNVYQPFAIAFGHLKALRPVGRHEAELDLKSGDTLKVRASSTDLGVRMRSFRIDDPQAGAVELRWSEIKQLTFSADPSTQRDRQRLFGTVTSRLGTFTGFIVWEAHDESLTEDVLDGTAAGEELELPFGEIAQVQRIDRETSRVVLKDGKQLDMTGTNDVGEGHGGVAISIPSRGSVRLQWRDVEKVEFKDVQHAPPATPYANFDGGRRLRGRVTLRSGEPAVGAIVWGADERFTWEYLEGNADGAEWAVPFANIREIRRVGSKAAITLRDETKLELGDTRDVGPNHRGIEVTTTEGNAVQLEWSRVQSVVFD